MMAKPDTRPNDAPHNPPAGARAMGQMRDRSIHTETTPHPEDPRLIIVPPEENPRLEIAGFWLFLLLAGAAGIHAWLTH